MHASAHTLAQTHQYQHMYTREYNTYVQPINIDPLQPAQNYCSACVFVSLSLQLQSYMSDFPVTGITVHHNKESKVLYGFVQSFKAELRPGSTLNGTLLQVLKDKITTVRRIGGRTKSTQSYTAGVIGVTTSGVFPVGCLPLNM